MATFKTVARNKRTDGFWHVDIRVTHNRKTKFIKTEKMITDREISNGEIIDPFVLNFCTSRICEYQTRLNQVNIEHWDIKQVVDYLIHPIWRCSFEQN